MTIIIQDIAIKTTARAPMENRTQVNISLDKGLEDDFRGGAENRQVTILSADSWQKTCADIGVDLPWTTRRANLLIEGFEFSADNLGCRIKIGEVELLVTEETKPCSLMDKQQTGLKSALTPPWRGGACCKVLTPGSVKIGDTLEVVS